MEARIEWNRKQNVQFVHNLVNTILLANVNSRIASPVLAIAIPSVCLSVPPSHAGIMSKRRHVARCSLHCQIAQEAQLSLRDRATRACQLKSGKVLHKCRRLVFEKL